MKFNLFQKVLGSGWISGVNPKPGDAPSFWLEIQGDEALTFVTHALAASKPVLEPKDAVALDSALAAIAAPLDGSLASAQDPGPIDDPVIDPPPPDPKPVDPVLDGV